MIVYIFHVTPVSTGTDCVRSKENKFFVIVNVLSQYLELRFSVGVRMVGCLFFILEYVSTFL